MRLIDADALIDKTDDRYSLHEIGRRERDDIVDALEYAPTIQPKRGKWHYSDGKPARIGLSFGVVCDQCGTESEYCTNFCGECGADMREVNNENN